MIKLLTKATKQFSFSKFISSYRFFLFLFTSLYTSKDNSLEIKDIITNDKHPNKYPAQSEKKMLLSLVI